MTKNLFYEEIRKKISQSVSDCEVELAPIVKNNDTVRMGINIRKSEEGISPTIYLDAFYQGFENGSHTVDEIVKHVIEMSHEVART